jgi:hypothetical protein
MDGTTRAANRIMYEVCYLKTYISNDLLGGYQINISMVRGDNMGADRDLSIGIGSFLDVLVSW